MSVATPELIPVRMLNEFAYCPRLAYLEWVQGEFRENLETREGTFGHRRVDRPTTQAFDAPVARRPAVNPRTAFVDSLKQAAVGERNSPLTVVFDDEVELDETALHARSLLLSAPGEGLIAKLDLLELEGNLATPVDYKRGQAPDLPEGAYEPERVQICAQALILRENGYRCDYGVLYFIESRRRVQIPIDDALVARTRELIAGLRAVASETKPPPPLVDSPKCPRCSLVSICLPDETHLLSLGDQARSQDVRQLMPARDDGLPLYVHEQGAHVGKDGERLLVRSRGEKLCTARLLDISQVSLFGNVQISSQAIKALTARDVPVCYFSHGGWFQAMTVGLSHKNVDLRRAQFAVAADAGQSLAIARQFIVGKIKNCRTLLRRHLPDKKAACLRSLNELSERAQTAVSCESLLGFEGMAAKTYFASFAQLLKGPATFRLEGRNRRPPTDPVNCLLSFVYALLAKDLTVTAQAVGFDPMLGYLHQPRYGRPSLALDLAEEFRPLIGDSVVMMLINNGEVRESDFIGRAGSVALTPSGRRSVIAAYERRMDSLVTHPKFGYRISYRRILEVQARLLARTTQGELATYPDFRTR